MLALTPTREHTIYQIAAEMMAAATSDADTARIDRALDLVSGVERTSIPGRFLVRSQSNPDGAYLVDHGTCHCPDATRRDSRNCKHSWAVRLFGELERAETDAEQAIPTCGCLASTGLRVRHAPNCSAQTLTVRVDPEDSILDLWPGEPCDLPAQCPRCHAEPRTTRHPDGLGMACISAELFGEV